MLEHYRMVVSLPTETGGASPLAEVRGLRAEEVR